MKLVHVENEGWKNSHGYGRMYINQTNALFDLFKWVGRTGENIDTDKMRTETDQNTRNA